MAHYNENNKLMITDVQGFPSRFRRVFAAGVAAALSLCAPQLPAATIIVTGTEDGALASGCTLRAAIINAETASKAGSIACARGDAGADTIILQPEPVRVTSNTVEESDAAQGDIDITTEITILGGGQQFSIVDADSTGRLFDVQAGGQLTLSRILLRGGYADDLSGGQPHGGAVRVAGTLIGDDLGIQFSVTSDLVADGRGGGIYAAPGSVVSLNRSALHWNRSQGVNGSGGAIYCDGCQLNVSTTSFGENQAQVAAGIYIEAGSTAVLEYTTVGFNGAPAYAGLYNAGALQLFASIFADNGSALSGDDMFCAGGTFTAEYSFIEYPQGCTPLAGVRTRAADLAAGFEPQLLRELTHNRFSGQPSFALPWERGVFYMVPAAHAKCVGHLDQLGTPGVHTPSTGPASNDPGCLSGSYEEPVAAISPMLRGAVANGPNVTFDIGVLGTLTADAEMHFRTRGAGGIAEACDFKDPLTGLPPAPVAIPAGALGLTFSIDPDWLFHTPSLDRHKRVCEIEGVIVSPEAAFNGATTGVIRIIFDDGLLGAGNGFSSPAPGSYLQFGTVPYGDYVPFVDDGRDGGGDASIFFFSGADLVHITDASVSDPARFQVNNVPTALAPLVVPVGPAAAAALSVRCKGGTFGDFDGVLTVSAVRNPMPETAGPEEPLVLVYGLRCRVAHLLTVSASPYFGRIGEGDGRDLELIGRLDSPNATGGPISFDFIYDGGTATQGSDFSFMSPFAATIPANAGASGSLLVQVNDDLVYDEPDESLLMHAVLPLRNDVELSGSGAATMEIVDNDEAVDGAAVTLTGMPSHVAPASQIEVQVVAENTSGVATLGNVHVVSNVDAPARLLSYLVTEVQVTCPAYTEYLIQKYESNPLAMPPVDCTNLSSLPQGVSMANELAFLLLSGSLCEISVSQREGDCAFSRGVPAGTRVSIRAIVGMATMADAPQLDFPGDMTVRMGGVGAQGPVLVTDTASYVIDGNEKAKEGALGWPFLMVLGLLALRGRRERSAGRKIG